MKISLHTTEANELKQRKKHKHMQTMRLNHHPKRVPSGLLVIHRIKIRVQNNNPKRSLTVLESRLVNCHPHKERHESPEQVDPS